MTRPVNARQLEVLRWVADGCPEGRWARDDFTYKTTAGALKGRGLITIKGHGRTWQAAITEAGTYFLDHGEYPPGHSGGGTPGGRRQGAAGVATNEEPVELGDKAQATVDEAKALIEQVSASGGSITVADPSEPFRARYRRLLHACRMHRLVPPGQELRFTGRDAGDIVIAIGDGSDEATSDWLRIRTTSRRVTTNLDALRHGLDSSTILHSISEDLRPRAIDVICDLAEELRKHDLKLGINVKLKTPKLFVRIDTTRRDVTIAELTKQVPHVRTPAEEREARRHPWTSIPATDDVPTGKLSRLTVYRDGWRMEGGGNRDEWDDAPKKPLSAQLATIARAIKKGVIDDADAHARAEQARAEALERHERERAEQQRAWEAQRQKARAKAAEQLRGKAFAQAMDDWRTAHDLRAFCDELGAVADTDDGHLRDWIAWARQSADQLDAAAQARRLNDLDFDIVVTTDDIEPYMEGWSTSGPYKASAYTQSPSQPIVPQPRPWHPGMREQANWWR